MDFNHFDLTQNITYIHSPLVVWVSKALQNYIIENWVTGYNYTNFLEVVALKVLKTTTCGAASGDPVNLYYGS